MVVGLAMLDFFVPLLLNLFVSQKKKFSSVVRSLILFVARFFVVFFVFFFSFQSNCTRYTNMLTAMGCSASTTIQFKLCNYICERSCFSDAFLFHQKKNIRIFTNRKSFPSWSSNFVFLLVFRFVFRLQTGNYSISLVQLCINLSLTLYAFFLFMLLFFNVNHRGVCWTVCFFLSFDFMWMSYLCTESVQLFCSFKRGIWLKHQPMLTCPR